MIFRQHLVDEIVAGRKTVTRRKSDRYRVGHTYAVQPGRGKKGVARILVIDVRSERFDPHGISDEEAQREGFAWCQFNGPAEKFTATWHEIHGSTDPVDVFRVEFELSGEEAGT